MENISFSLHSLSPLHNYPVIDELSIVNQMITPPSFLILLLEALIIIITPTRLFRGPSPNVGTVSWQASLNVLQDKIELYKRMKDVDLNQVPIDNLDSLHKYINHKHWPTSNLMTSFNNAFIHLHAWVENVVKYATLLAGEGGAPPRMSRKEGLFDSVCICKDGSEDGYEELVGGKKGFFFLITHLIIII